MFTWNVQQRIHLQCSHSFCLGWTVLSFYSLNCADHTVLSSGCSQDEPDKDAKLQASEGRQGSLSQPPLGTEGYKLYKACSTNCKGCVEAHESHSQGCQHVKGMRDSEAWQKELITSHMPWLDHVQGGAILSTFSEEYCENEHNIICKTIRDAWKKATMRKTQVYLF